MTEENFKGKLNNLIANSDLDNNQKILWEIFTKISMDDNDEAVFEAVHESSENLNLLTKYLRDKIWDMKKNDNETWERLVAGEEKYARALTGNE